MRAAALVLVKFETKPSKMELHNATGDNHQEPDDQKLSKCTALARERSDICEYHRPTLERGQKG